MAYTKQLNSEPIPGYRLIAPLGCGGFGEVWKCEAPGGILKAIKFVYGNLNGVSAHGNQAHEELQAIQRIKEIRHPFLLSMDRVECAGDELMIVSELADKNLLEILQDYQRQGKPGVPREELLQYLAEAAEVLDLMNQKHGLQHLDIKPGNFLLVSNHVKVADFGLVASLAGNDAEIKQGAITPLYASPEVFQGKASSSSDQYSLACCYMELLTGQLPFQGRNTRQLLMQHVNAEPDLTMLPASDRPILARALAKDPTQRYAGCVEFIRALQTPRSTSFQKPSIGDPAPASRGARLDETSNSISSLADTTDSKAAPPAGAQWFIKGQTAVPPALAGYEFLENQGGNLLCDVWKAAAPDGRLRQVKFIYGFTGRAEYAVRRLLGMHHPALPAFEVAQSDPGCLVLVHDFVKETVRDRWQKCRAQKLPGIPRIELLAYLRTVAEVTDYLYQQHSIHHLALNPRMLLLADSGLQVADFGPAYLFWMPAGQPIGERNARYSAPELFERQIHRSTDQYSLAVMFQELLTGAHPFGGMSRAAPASMRARLNPNVSALPPSDREAIAKALDPDPQQRWPSCAELMRALDESEGAAEPFSRVQENVLREIVISPQQPPVPAACTTDGEELRQLIFELIAEAGGSVPETDPLALPQLSESGDELRHRFRVGLPVGTAREKIDAFRQQCQGRVLREDERRYEFQLMAPSNFWRQWIGQRPWLEISVELTPLHAMSATPIDVTMSAKAAGCGKKKATQLVQDLGTNLLEGLRKLLLVNSEKRTHDRLLWPHSLEVSGVEEDGSVRAAIVCRGKDISLTGIGFYLPHELPTAQVLIRLPKSQVAAELMIPATLVRAQRCADGWYDVGALFRLATLRKSRTDQHALSS